MARIPGKAHVSPRGRLELPEVALAPGPSAEAVVGAGTLADLYGYAWALVWDELSDPLLLYRLDGGAWVEQSPPSPLPELTKPARHVALAFDRSARAIIAWQSSSGIMVRQWDGSAGAYVLRGPFAGHDPVLVFDGLPRQKIGDSDVVLYHLSSDRSAVVARLERDLYATSYPVAQLGRTDLYLDQAVRLPYRVQLELATDQVADPTLPKAQQQLERVRLLSDLYPIPAGPERLGVAVAGRGDYVEMLQPVDVGAEPLGVAVAGRGDYVAVTRVAQPDAEPVAVSVAGRGDYVAVMRVAQPDAEPVAVSVAGRGRYEETTYVYDAGADAIDATVTARGEYRAQ